jgi:hypothetical protein
MNYYQLAMHLINNRLGAEDKPQSQVCKKNVLLGHPPNALAARRVKVSRLGHTTVVPSSSQLVCNLLLGV